MMPGNQGVPLEGRRLLGLACFQCDAKSLSDLAEPQLESDYDIGGMKLAFVIRLGTNSRPSENSFEGWVEEVDSCTERRFHSTVELLSFLGQCFDKATAGSPEMGGSSKEPPPCKKKKFR
jgi:hypothetical protein